MSSCKVMVGHVLDRLKEINSNSVHMVWTSVPYWGLRDYGTEHQVWGGEPDCQHKWGARVNLALPGANRDKRKVAKAQGSVRARGHWCSQCGAWRDSAATFRRRKTCIRAYPCSTAE